MLENELSSHEKTCMSFKCILNEGSQWEKDICHFSQTTIQVRAKPAVSLKACGFSGRGWEEGELKSCRVEHNSPWDGGSVSYDMVMVDVLHLHKDP